MYTIMYCIFSCIIFITPMYSDGPRGKSYHMYPMSYKEFETAGIDDALAISSIQFNKFSDYIYVVVNYTSKTFHVTLKVGGIGIYCKDIKLTIPGFDKHNGDISAVIERIFERAPCKLEKVVLYDTKKNKISPPGEVKFKSYEGSLLISIHEYLKSPGKYYVVVRALDNNISTDQQKILRDTRLSDKDKDQKINSFSKEALEYVQH